MSSRAVQGAEGRPDCVGVWFRSQSMVVNRPSLARIGQPGRSEIPFRARAARRGSAGAWYNTSGRGRCDTPGACTAHLEARPCTAAQGMARYSMAATGFKPVRIELGPTAPRCADVLLAWADPRAVPAARLRAHPVVQPGEVARGQPPFRRLPDLPQDRAHRHGRRLDRRQPRSTGDRRPQGALEERARPRPVPRPEQGLRSEQRRDSRMGELRRRLLRLSRRGGCGALLRPSTPRPTCSTVTPPA